MFKGIRFLREVKVKANWTKRFQSHIYHDESGITGLETAIILIAFIVVAAVFAFTVMTTGLFGVERAKTVARSGLSEAASSRILKGPATVKGREMDGKLRPWVLVFQVGLVGRVGEQVPLELDKLAFRYIDEHNSHSFGVPSIFHHTSAAAHGCTSYGRFVRGMADLGTIIRWVGLCRTIENSENQFLKAAS